jgi:hypothetical protein
MALAIYLGEPTEVDFASEVTATFAVPDPPALKEHLLSSKRVQNVQIDPAMFQEANEPPPLAAFLVLDREIPATSRASRATTCPR